MTTDLLNKPTTHMVAPGCGRKTAIVESGPAWSAIAGQWTLVLGSAKCYCSSMGQHVCLAFLKLVIFGALAPMLTIRPADNAKLDFSGAYTLTGAKGSFKIDKSSSWILDVVQSDAEIKITKTIDGKATTNRFMLDGTKAPYVSEGGVRGTCTARWKGKALIIETNIATRPQRGGPEVRMHTREQWTLSSDLKAVTIRSDVDFPNSGLGGFQIVEPWSEIYTRNRQ